MMKKILLIITLLATQSAFANPDKYLPFNPKDNDQEAKLRGLIRLGMTCELEERGSLDEFNKTKLAAHDLRISLPNSEVEDEHSVLLYNPGVSSRLEDYWELKRNALDTTNLRYCGDSAILECARGIRYFCRDLDNKTVDLNTVANTILEFAIITSKFGAHTAPHFNDLLNSWCEYENDSGLVLRDFIKYHKQCKKERILNKFEQHLVANSSVSTILPKKTSIATTDELSKSSSPLFSRSILTSSDRKSTDSKQSASPPPSRKSLTSSDNTVSTTYTFPRTSLSEQDPLLEKSNIYFKKKTEALSPQNLSICPIYTKLQVLKDLFDIVGNEMTADMTVAQRIVDSVPTTVINSPEIILYIMKRIKNEVSIINVLNLESWLDYSKSQIQNANNGVELMEGFNEVYNTLFESIQRRSPRTNSSSRESLVISSQPISPPLSRSSLAVEPRTSGSLSPTRLSPRLLIKKLSGSNIKEEK